MNTHQVLRMIVQGYKYSSPKYNYTGATKGNYLLMSDIHFKKNSGMMHTKSFKLTIYLQLEYMSVHKAIYVFIIAVCPVNMHILKHNFCIFCLSSGAFLFSIRYFR